MSRVELMRFRERQGASRRSCSDANLRLALRLIQTKGPSMNTLDQDIPRSRRDFLTTSASGLGLAMLVVTLPACGMKQQWQVTVENKSDVACSVFIALGADGSSKVSVADVTNGKVVTLIVGDNNTVVQTVKVVRGDDEQDLAPKAPLAVGKQYAIVVGDDGKVAAAIKD